MNMVSLRKHAYSNIQNISRPKTEIFQIKISDNFQISAPNKDCGYSLEPPRRGGSIAYQRCRRGGCIEYPQSMSLSKTKENTVYLSKPQFY